MLGIKKGPPPRCLVDLRTTPGADWSTVTGEQKSEIVARLRADQLGLCAYCLERVGNDPQEGKVRVEHWAARSAGGEPFAWHNLLAVCEGGGDGAPPSHQHCDRRKGDQALSVHPVRDADSLESRLKFRKNGRLDVLEEALRDELIDDDARHHRSVLNLNFPRLVANRRSVADAVVAAIKGAELAKVRRVLHRYETPDEAGELPPHPHVARELLRKVIAAREAAREHGLASSG